MHGNGIREQTSTTGSGSLTVASVSGFARFSEKYGTGTDNGFPYTILDGTSQAPLEYGWGYLSGTNTLVRALIWANYASPTYNDTTATAATLAAGTKHVILGAPWQAMQAGTNYGLQYAHSTGAYRAIFNALSTTNTTGANGWTSADRMHYWMFFAQEGAIVDGIVVSGVSNASSYKLGFGIYSIRTDGRPGKRLASLGSATPTAGSAPQIISFSGSAKLALPPGPYWFGAVVNNTALTFDKETCRPFHMGAERSGAAPVQGFVENVPGWTDVPASGDASMNPYSYAGGYVDHPCIGLHVA